MTRLSHALSRRVLALGAALLVLALASPSFAVPEALEGQPAIRNRVLLFEGRHMVAPTFGFTVADAYEQSLFGGLGWRYYFEEWVGIGVDLVGGGAVATSLTDQINRELSSDTFTFDLSTTHLQFLATAAVEFVPFVGKFKLFGEGFARIDVHVTVGGALAVVSGSGRLEDSVTGGPVLGIGMRLFPEPWIAIGFEVRDYLLERTLAETRRGAVPAPTWDNNWYLGFSLGFMLPLEPETEE